MSETVFGDLLPHFFQGVGQKVWVKAQKQDDSVSSIVKFVEGLMLVLMAISFTVDCSRVQEFRTFLR